MIYLVIFILFAAGLLVSALLLHLTIKIFKVSGANYRTTFIVFIWQWIAALVIGAVLDIIMSFLGLVDMGTILAVFIGAVVFHKLLQKYYRTGFKKNISIYIVSAVMTAAAFLVIIIPMRSFVIMPFYVKGSAMEPTYKDGDYLLINKLSKKYQRGDIVIFRYPQNPKEFFIKRIIALPGEKIQLKNGLVYLYNQQNPAGYQLNEPYLQSNTKTFGLDEKVIELGDNEYYMLGDNRSASKDSRSFGPVKESYFIGKVWFKAGER
jgi:signal peptidase I